VGPLFAALGLELVALGFGARHRLAPVLAGVVTAYAACNLLSVVVGGLLGAALPTRGIGLVGGVLFLALAVWNLRQDDEDEEGEVGGDRIAARAVFASVATTMFLAELGDKTMLATATLAAQNEPVLVWIGATLGIVASGVLGVLLGRAFGARLPAHVTRIGSSVLFAGFGLGLLIANI
jgi:putative Ca2+/H+ antiporter (TMEM165/GDT1 family)